MVSLQPLFVLILALLGIAFARPGGYGRPGGFDSGFGGPPVNQFGGGLSNGGIVEQEQFSSSFVQPGIGGGSGGSYVGSGGGYNRPF
ncbi:hypothetical protein FO519_008402 [Halicephalobus sp. NKZ332]|nr:hypothetical protein FO519_008402 [Halicephalobus sp. NKZ332]